MLTNSKIKAVGKSKPLPNNKILVTFKADKDLKKEVEKTLDKLGISLSVVLNSVMRTIARDKKFEVSLDRVTFSSIEEFEEKVAEGFKGKMINLKDSILTRKIKELEAKLN